MKLQVDKLKVIQFCSEVDSACMCLCVCWGGIIVGIMGSYCSVKRRGVGGNKGHT